MRWPAASKTCSSAGTPGAVQCPVHAGVAFDDEESRLGLSRVAAPVLSRHASPRADDFGRQLRRARR
ncbi:MAG TPA: hypothetical protein VJT49_34780 [Amycolatopsis sp.]|uniref:hypothetical protein n=1 Tax=Amycolatopsis sp. TaxID=37632 RepID=UPI002B460065|nr:hypothetical protein [Amycolatopsis sp.]HKS50187.1 hypothetical protein [Amycolatopsis sp.]